MEYYHLGAFHFYTNYVLRLLSLRHAEREQLMYPYTEGNY